VLCLLVLFRRELKYPKEEVEAAKKDLQLRANLYEERRRAEREERRRLERER
jgi:hypothetical protein